MSFPPRIKYGVNSSRNPEKYWIPGQARNDKLYKTYKEKKCYAELGSASKEIKD
jgi:hypothetical protein